MVNLVIRARNALGIWTPIPPDPTPGIARLPFSDGFESGNLNAWDVHFGNMNTSTLEAYEGTRSSRIVAPGGGTPNDNYLEFNFGDAPSVDGTPTGMRDLWLRMAHKWSSNWLDNGYASVQKVFLLNIHNPASGQRRHQLTFNIWTPTQQYFCEFLRILENGSFSGTTTPNIDVGVFRTLGQWVEFVFRVRMNNLGLSDGILQIWSKQQGASVYTQRINRTNINYRESNNFSPNRLIQSNFQPDGIPSGSRYWDSWQLQEEAIEVGGSTGGFQFTRFVSASASGSGNGLTQGTPWTMAQALANANPGDVIRIAGGVYNGNHTGQGRVATFSINRAGTASQPIYWVCENYAALTATNRSQFTNNGNFATEACSPVFGITAAHNHVYGIYVLETAAQPGIDTGSVYITGAGNQSFNYCHLDRASAVWETADPASNYASNTSGMFIEPGINLVVANNKFTNYTCPVQRTYGKACAIIFSPSSPPYSHDVVFENNEIDNCNLFVYCKGAGSQRPVTGGIIYRKNKCRLATTTDGNNYFVNMSDTGTDEGINIISQNLIIAATGSTICRGHIQGGGYATRGLHIVNNTTIGFRAGGDSGWFYTEWAAATTTPSSHRCHNNIHYNATPGGTRMYSALFGGNDSSWLSCDHNTAFNSTATSATAGQWIWVNSAETLAQYRTRTGRDMNSSIRDPLLVSTTWGNAQLGHLQAGSPERNTGVDVLNLLGGGTSAPINRGCFITSGMTDVIGIMPIT